MSPTGRIQAFSETMRHIRQGLDIVAEDLAEMYRRASHPGGRIGQRRKGLQSDLGIPGYPKETITIELGRASEGDNIKVLHCIGPMVLSSTVDQQIVLRAPDKKYEDLPETIKVAFLGANVEKIIDLSKTSIASLGKAIIHSVYANGNGTISIYIDGPVTAYNVPALLEMKTKPTEKQA